MLSSGSRKGPVSDINVTPLVDVMLVLLIIFMVTAPMMQQGIPVNLPRAAAGGMDAPEGKIVVTVTKSEDIFINQSPLPLAALADKLSSIYRYRSNKEIFLKADGAVPYGTVIRVMAEIKSAGIDQIGMVTAPPEKSRR